LLLSEQCLSLHFLVDKSAKEMAILLVISSR